MNGKHDDCVMALAIAHYIRFQQSFIVAKPPDTFGRTKMLANAKRLPWEATADAQSGNYQYRINVEDIQGHV